MSTKMERFHQLIARQAEEIEVTSVFDSKGNRVCDMRGWGFLTGKGHCACKLPEDEAAKIQDQMGEHIAALLSLDIDTLVDKFLTWPLPDSVCADLCATRQNTPHRSGTNLLSALEARQMLEYLFKVHGGTHFYCLASNCGKMLWPTSSRNWKAVAESLLNVDDYEIRKKILEGNWPEVNEVVED